MWIAGFPGKAKPMRRAARHDGFTASAAASGTIFFPVNLDSPDQLATIVADVAALREEAGRDTAEPYDYAVALPPGTDPAPYAAVGATWCMVEFEPEAVSVDEVRGVLRDGPP